MPWPWLLLPLLSLNLYAGHRLLRRLQQAQHDLRLTRERAERAEAAVAQLGASAMLTDAGQNVIACGAAAARLLGLESAAGARFATTAKPAGAPGQTLGAIDAGLLPLRGVNERSSLVLQRASRQLRCTVTPLHAPGGARCGYLVDWRDAGEERAQRQQSERDQWRHRRDAAALAALDDSLLLADTELMIDWHNEAMGATLAALGAETISRLRVATVDAASGAGLRGVPLSVLDSGELQAEALRTPEAAPRVVQLELAGRRFEVRATPLRDADGCFLGVALRWKDRTEATRLEARILKVVADLNRYQLASRVALDGASGPLATLGEGLNQVGDAMAGIVSTVSTLAREVSASAASIADENRQLGEQSARAAHSLADTARSTRELSAATRQLTENAHLASELAHAMRSSAERGGEVVHEAREAMSTIERTSRRMADVVDVIDGLAFQTNLLALNAAIEAAHAGRHGGGFAVVAGEVRALAARSKSAAQEVNQLISDSLRCVAAGSERVTQSEQSLQEIIQAAASVDEVIAGIDAVAVQQAEGIGQIDAAMLELERFTRGHSALVERTAVASGALAEQSADLAGLMKRYRLPEVIVNAPKLRARKRPGEAGPGWAGNVAAARVDAAAARKDAPPLAQRA